MRISTVIVLCSACLVAAPGVASAQWSVTPQVGALFGGDATDAPKVAYGVAAGWMRGIFGVEVDASYAPDFFAVSDNPEELVGASSVTTTMFSGLLGIPFGGDRIRPYAVAGIGLIRTDIGDADSFVRGSANNIGFNIGGGVVGSLSDRFGVRGDVRYFRDLQDVEGDSEFFPDRGKLDFWRATAGVVIRF